MSHTFDSGLADAMRTLLANAITAKLTPLLIPALGGEAGGFVEEIATISFGIDGKHELDQLDLLWEAVGKRSPSIAIFPGMLKPQSTSVGQGKSRGPLVVEIYFVSTHLRGVTEGRATGDAIAAASDSADPGIFALVELAWARLVDVDLGVGAMIGPMKLEDERELSTDMERTVWRQQWRIDVSRDANMYRGLLQKLTDAHTTLKHSAPTDEPIAERIVEDTIVG